MDGSNPDSGGGGCGCGGECEMNDDCGCEVCAMWRGIYSWKHKSDGAKQCLVPASDDSRDSSASDNSRDSLRIPQKVGCHLRIPKSEPVKAPDGRTCAEQDVTDPGHVQTSNDIVYTTLPGCFLTKEQDEKVQAIACTRKPEIPLFVAAMNKRNVYLKDSSVYIPLLLVLNHFNDKVTKPTIQLEAPDNRIYSVGASKHNDDQVILDSGWDTFVASHRIQEKDLVIFRSTEKSCLEVLILDPSGHEKTSSCFVMGNSSSTQSMSGDSVHIVAPPPRAVFELSSSDDDDIVREGARESCRTQKRVARSCVKAQKIASMSSPSTKLGYGARKPHDRASVKLGVGSVPASNNIGGPSQQPYILDKRAALPLPVERKVEEKVQKIGSELPIFVKVMSKTSLEDRGSTRCRMDFCTDYASACLPDETQPLLLQLEGKRKLWHATLSVASRGQRRRQVYHGWKEFVGENQLKEGDVCLFQLAGRNTRSLRMTVHLVR